MYLEAPLAHAQTFFGRYMKYILLIALLYFPVFGHLDTIPIRIWDEGRVAVNAYEMYMNGNYIVTYFEGQPDTWNTKPPLLNWLQVLLMHTIGINELAVRLPSAFAAFFTCLALLFFSLRLLNNFWFGFMAAMVLVTSQGYIEIHGTRTGDYDALLTFFTTVSCLSFFGFLQTQKNAYLYAFFICLALAVLTKSVAGLLFLPAIFFFTLYSRQMLKLLKNKHFYLGIALFLFQVSGYYFLREWYQPGYLNSVYENELGGRYLEVIEEHRHGFTYYMENFIDIRFIRWYPLLLCGVVVGLMLKDVLLKRLTLFSTLLFLNYFLIISTSQTKLEWYDLPLFPIMSILVAIFIYVVFLYLKNINALNLNLRYNVFPFVFLFLFCLKPYQVIVHKTYLPHLHESHKDLYEIGYFLKDAIKGKINVNNQYLLYKGYNAQNLFYINILKHKGVNIDYKDWTKLTEGDEVITHQLEIKEYLEQNYAYDIVRLVGNVLTYKIHGNKNI